MNDEDFVSQLTDELAELPGVVAVALGGSRARGTHHARSDWDFALYYRGVFEPSRLRAKGWEGTVSEVGGWGGGVMNGGAWLNIDDRRVDVHYRDLDEVEHWCTEAEAGRFNKELLLFYVAGIPTYVVMGELALHVVLAGDLPVPGYPEALSKEASRRWHNDAMASLAYAESALRHHDDTAIALANALRALIEAAHARLAARHQWVVNEKGILHRADLDEEAQRLVAATTTEELLAALSVAQAPLDAGSGC